MMIRIFKATFALAAIALSLLAQSGSTSPADISGDGVAHAIGSGLVRQITVICPSSNTSTVRLGDSGISTTRGKPLAPGAGFFFPPRAPNYSDSPNSQGYLYDLSKIFYLVQSGDKVSISWE